MAPPAQPANQFAALPVGAKIFILVAILVALAVAYYTSFHLGLQEDIEAAALANVAKRQQLVDAERLQKRFFDLREELAGREPIDRQNLRVLPEDPEIPAFLADLNRIADLSGLRMQEVTPQPHQSEEFYVRVPVQLSLSGKYHQLAKFFHNTSRLERAINMEDIHLDDPTMSGEDIVLSVDVRATTFRRNVDAAAGGTKP
jgi:type IV pilus assembly protein PilO